MYAVKSPHSCNIKTIVSVTKLKFFFAGPLRRNVMYTTLLDSHTFIINTLHAHYWEWDDFPSKIIYRFTPDISLDKNHVDFPVNIKTILI